MHTVMNRWTLLLWIMCLCVGCRIPKLFIPVPDKVLRYDTKLEQEIADKPVPKPDDIEYDYRWRYRDSLAEPVTNVSWNQEVDSSWKILFATNRVPVKSEGTKNIRIGNQYDQSVHYGTCKVTLSHQEPDYEEPTGKDLKSKLTRVLPVSWQKELTIDEADIGHVEDVQQTVDTEFLTELNQQLEHSRQKDLLLFVHGFNVSFEAAVIRLAQLTKEMPFNGAVVAYSWPSQGGVANYPVDGEIVNESVKPFAEILNQLITQLPPETRINIIVHRAVSASVFTDTHTPRRG